MIKSQEELTKLKIEYEALTSKLQELSDEELNMVTGGIDFNLLREFMGLIFRPLDSTTDKHAVTK